MTDEPYDQDDECANCGEPGHPGHHWFIQEGITRGMYICDHRPELTEDAAPPPEYRT